MRKIIDKKIFKVKFYKTVGLFLIFFHDYVMMYDLIV